LWYFTVQKLLHDTAKYQKQAKPQHYMSKINTTTTAGVWAHPGSAEVGTQLQLALLWFTSREMPQFPSNATQRTQRKALAYYFWCNCENARVYHIRSVYFWIACVSYGASVALNGNLAKITCCAKIALFTSSWGVHGVVNMYANY